MITAMSTKNYINRAFTAGASDYITKPFDVLELCARIRIAGTMVEKQRHLIEKTHVIDALNKELTKSDHYDIHESLNIDNVDRVIDYLTFEKHIFQLSHGTLFSSQIFAIKIANIRRIHTRSSAAKFKNTLTDIADIIAKNLLGNSSRISYRGNGVFVCIAHRSNNLMLENLKILINNDLINLGMMNSKDVQLKIDLIFGEAKTPGVFTKRDSLGLLQEAVNSVAAA